MFIGGVAAAQDAEAKPYLVVLDFASPFDEGRLGRQAGRMVRAKAARRGLFSVDMEIDWDELRGRMPPPDLDADAETTAAAAREAFGCDVLLWGRIEKPDPDAPDVVKRHEGYTTTRRSDAATRTVLRVRALDLRRDPPALAVRRTFDLGNEYGITRALDEVLKTLSGAPTPAEIDAAHVRHRMAAAGPNRVPHGGMRFPDRPTAKTWRSAFGGWHFPMKEGIRAAALDHVARTTEDGEEIGETWQWTLCYDLSPEVAATTGLFCYTPYVPVEPETYYQAALELETEGPSVILFVKGYREMAVEGYAGTETHRQEVFKHQKRFYGEKGAWRRLVTEPFLPRAVKAEHTPRWLRIQLYAYHPAGRVRFREASIRRCVPKDAEAAEGKEEKGEMGEKEPAP